MSAYPILRPKSPAQADAKFVPLLRSLLTSQGYTVPATANPNLYDAKLRGVVRLFQAQHTDKDGKWLQTDETVGPLTWWALENPSGKAQAGPAPAKAKPTAPSSERLAVVKEAFRWFKMPTKEIPDGSNWGGNVTKILQNYGKPAAWCMFFVSRVFKEALGRWPLGANHGGCKAFMEAAKKVAGAWQPIGNGYVPRPGDVGVIVHPNGQGHVFWIVAISAGTALGYMLETIGGNEGNQVKLSRRDTWRITDFKGFVNLFGDASEPYRPEGLMYTKDGAHSDPTTR